MPTFGSYSSSPWEINPRRWAACLRAGRDEVEGRGIMSSHRRYCDLVRQAALKRFRAPV